MPTRSKTPAITDWKAIARVHAFSIPDCELKQIVDVLDPLVSDCRNGFDESLSLVEPVGAFHLEEE